MSLLTVVYGESIPIRTICQDIRTPNFVRTVEIMVISVLLRDNK